MSIPVGIKIHTVLYTCRATLLSSYPSPAEENRYLVCLVCLVERNSPDEPNNQINKTNQINQTDRLAPARTSNESAEKIEDKN